MACTKNFSVENWPCLAENIVFAIVCFTVREKTRYNVNANKLKLSHDWGKSFNICISNDGTDINQFLLLPGYFETNEKNEKISHRVVTLTPIKFSVFIIGYIQITVI